MPHPRWDGIRDAFEYAPTAPQPERGLTIIPEPVIDGGNAPSCLSLNIFTPDLGSAGLPVLVWIHGGGFTSGTPSSPWYDGRSFNRDGVVVVSIGYRLGAEGFLHLQDAPDNRGVLDWLAGLQWVHDNIAAFGGDPTQVTIGGQSAGGGAVCTLASLPQARGLFRGVMAMSGSVSHPPTADQARWIADAVAAELDMTPTRVNLSGVAPGDPVAAQAAGPANAVKAARSRGEAETAPRLTFQPFVDGTVIPERPLDAMRSGRTDHLALLIGTTEQEFNATAMGLELTEAELTQRMSQFGFTAESAHEYAKIRDDSPAAVFGQAVTDMMFRIPALRACTSRTQAHAGTFRYEFRWRTDVLQLGSVHCLDLPFAWDLLDADGVEAVAGTAPPQQLADRMHHAWVDFVSTGDAGWASYRNENRATMIFDETCHEQQDLLADVERVLTHADEDESR